MENWLILTKFQKCKFISTKAMSFINHRKYFWQHNKWLLFTWITFSLMNRGLNYISEGYLMNRELKPRKSLMGYLVIGKPRELPSLLFKIMSLMTRILFPLAIVSYSWVVLFKHYFYSTHFFQLLRRVNIYSLLFAIAIKHVLYNNYTTVYFMWTHFSVYSFWSL